MRTKRRPDPAATALEVQKFYEWLLGVELASIADGSLHVPEELTPR